MKPVRIAFITTGLLRGGAEMVLWQLASHMDRARFDPVVISLRPAGPVQPLLEESGIKVHSAKMNPYVPNPAAWVRLRRLVEGLQPDILQGWMYHGNLAAAWCRKAMPRAALFFAIHNSIYNLSKEKWLTAMVIRRGARLSRSCSGVIYCAESTARLHEDIGYSAHRTIVIPNGFDISRFQPSSSARAELRHELRIDAHTKLVGLMARFDRHKGHEDFFAMANIVAEKIPGIRFVLAGRGIEASNSSLHDMIVRHGVSERVHLLGERSDMPHLMAGLDLLVSSSTSEAFPVVIGEALACGVPCCATDIGDSKLVLGPGGEIVPARNPQDLAQSVVKLLASDENTRVRIGLAGREHIVTKYSLETMVRRYSEVYTQGFKNLDQGRAEACAE